MSNVDMYAKVNDRAIRTTEISSHTCARVPKLGVEKPTSGVEGPTLITIQPFYATF